MFIRPLFVLKMMPIIGKRGAAKEQISAINLAIQRLNSSTNHLLVCRIQIMFTLIMFNHESHLL